MSSVFDVVPKAPVGLVTNVPLDVATNLTVTKLTNVAKEYLTTARYPLAFVISPTLPLLLLSLLKEKHSPDTARDFKKEYDYIIVGSGSAGSVLASRLSEEDCASVLLLEAGKTSPLLTDVPLLAPVFFQSDIDWNYTTVPQRNTGSGLTNRQFPFVSGKCVGGTSTINAMFAVRGNCRDYDHWERLGAKGWSYKDVLPYFLKLENNTEQEFLKNGYHATGGPITLEKPRYRPKLKEPLMQAAKNLGYNFVDSNADTQTGFFNYESTMRVGRRCSAAKGYLVPAENRKNLDILEKAMVLKVLINNDKKAYGVRFDWNGTTHEVKARKEVILSAGAIGSPQLLMLSGIGPKEHLQQFDIPVLSDLRVGDNLQDHVASVVLQTLDVTQVLPTFVTVFNPLNQLEYIENRTNAFAGSYAGPLLAFLNLEGPGTQKDFPDYEMYFAESPDFIFKQIFNLNEEFYRKMFDPYKGRPFFACVSQLLHPKSTGTVRLRSANPYDLPRIDPMYYTDPEDVRVVMEGMKTCRKMCASAPMKALGCAEFTPVYPGCEDFLGDEDKYLECMVRTLSVTIWHKTCTNKMGDPADPSTVVDPQLRVKGVRNLRVVDASVMPSVTSGNTNLPTMMIAEKIADEIRQDIRCDYVIKGQCGVRYPGDTSEGWEPRCCDERSGLKHIGVARNVEVRTAEVRNVEARNVEVHNGESRNGKVRSGEVNNGEVRNGEVRNAEDRNGEARNGEVRNTEVHNGESRNGRDRSREVNNGEVRNGDIRNGVFRNRQGCGHCGARVRNNQNVERRSPTLVRRYSYASLMLGGRNL